MGGLNSRVEQREESIYELQDRRIEIIQSEQPRENGQKKVNAVSGTRGTMNKRSPNSCVTRVWKEQERGRDEVFFKMAGNFLHLAKDINLQIEENE